MSKIFFDQMPDETVKEFLDRRIKSDDTADNAKLDIVYRENGVFRRVLCGMTGKDLKELIK